MPQGETMVTKVVTESSRTKLLRGPHRLTGLLVPAVTIDGQRLSECFLEQPFGTRDSRIDRGVPGGSQGRFDDRLPPAPGGMIAEILEDFPGQDLLTEFLIRSGVDGIDSPETIFEKVAGPDGLTFGPFQVDLAIRGYYSKPGFNLAPPGKSNLFMADDGSNIGVFNVETPTTSPVVVDPSFFVEFYSHKEMNHLFEEGDKLFVLAH